MLASLSDEACAALLHDWAFWARPEQLPPEDDDWDVFLLLGGRGSGKSRPAAELIHRWAHEIPGGYFALVGETAAEVRDVMLEGEALSLATSIPTPKGWMTLGDLAAGDEVFAGDGTVTQIVALSPTWEHRPCYSLTADGARPIVADAHHQWVTSSRADRRPDRRIRGARLRSTEDLANTTPRRNDLYEYELPIHGRLQLPIISLPIAPYTLGAWLGDGSTRGDGAFTCHPQDAEILERINKDRFAIRPRVGSYAWGIQGLRVLLHNTALAGRKQIPSVYLRAGGEQRLALLQGLMDTDGYVSKRGQCAFDNTNRILVEQTRELALTLGFKVGQVREKHDKRGYLPTYRITFTCTAITPIPFHLGRKAQRCIHALQPQGRLIRSVEPVDSMPVRCIQVAHASGTFLAGEDFIVTHNSGHPRHAEALESLRV